jgi:hypothetical protein
MSDLRFEVQTRCARPTRIRVRARLPRLRAQEDDRRMATTRPEPAGAPGGQVPGKKKRNLWVVEIAADCAKAYVSAISSALGGKAADVRGQLETITADCKTALTGA